MKKIIKTNDQRVLFFFNNNGLCVKNLLKPFENYKMLYEESVCDFDVISLNDGVGVICQNTKGSILFLKEQGENWLKTILLNNRSQLAYDKNFCLLNNGNWISGLYLIDYQGKKMLSHQILNEENQSPNAVDYLSNTDYYAYVNDTNDIVAVYSKGTIGYNIYKWSKKDWDGFVRICEGKMLTAQNDNKGNCYIICENNNDIYINYLYRTEYIYQVEETKIDFLNPNDEIVIICENEKLWVMYKRGEFIFFVSSENNGKTFSSPVSFVNDGDSEIIKVMVNDSDFSLSKCFGNEKNMIPKLFLYKNLYSFKNMREQKEILVEGREVEQLAKVPEVKEASHSQIELNKLKISIKNLENSNKELEQKLMKLENVINDLSK